MSYISFISIFFFCTAYLHTHTYWIFRFLSASSHSLCNDKYLSSFNFKFWNLNLRISLGYNVQHYAIHDTPVHRNVMFSTANGHWADCIRKIRPEKDEKKKTKNAFNVCDGIKQHDKNENFIWICQTWANIRFGFFPWLCFFFAFQILFAFTSPRFYVCTAIEFYVRNRQEVRKLNIRTCINVYISHVFWISRTPCALYRCACGSLCRKQKRQKPFETPEICTYRYTLRISVHE